MSWTQEDSYWSRPFDWHDELLQFVRIQGEEINREQWMFMVTTKIGFTPQSDNIVNRLRIAWKALRFRHPDIALEVHGSEKRYYPVYNDQSLETWCNETFRVETECSSAEDFFTQHRCAAPLANATFHWVPTTSEFALVSAHVLWDGRGGISMVHEFLSTLENPVLPPVFDGAEAKNLVPSLDAVIGMPDKPKPEWEEKADEILRQYVAAQPSIGLLPPGDPKAKALPAEMKRTKIVLSPEIAKSLREATWKQNITISTAVQTAAIMALVDVNNRDSQPENFVAWSFFDLRKSLPPPFNGPEHAPSVRLGCIPMVSKAHSSWSEISKTVDQLNRTPWNMKESDNMFVRQSLNRKSLNMFKAVASQPPELQPPPQSEPFISSMGILEDYIKHDYGPFSVANVEILIQSITPVICLHFWSWRGSLHLSVSYNVAFYTSDDVQRYLTILKDTMQRNLLSFLSVPDE
ncbi:hypothetical protein N7478_010500 [Penicillium angulare]|uniref:uncharacterized protein n=1 Tax=Penicillium angulare TaxID=116970 RepID=UPI00253F906E|nr:uncharacterized protein N7478_010500 [Penicillium angulare]KAJ5267692.1 hypothetical protein N7478_010500 [Penicillium angulare]